MKYNCFNIIVSLISDDPIFKNSYRDSQGSPVVQFATGLHFLGPQGVSTTRGAVQLGIRGHDKILLQPKYLGVGSTAFAIYELRGSQL